MRPHRLALSALLAAAALGVSTRPAAAQDSAATPVKTVKDAPPAKRDRNVISAEELAAPERKAQTVLEVIHSLRPNFLNNRGGGQSCLRSEALGGCNANDQEAGKVHASIDGNPVISVQELGSLHVANVIEIRFLDAGQAMQKFGGSAHQGPVILVKTM